MRWRRLLPPTRCSCRRRTTPRNRLVPRARPALLHAQCNVRLWQLLCEVEAHKLRVKEVEQQLSETRSSVEEQQQQLVAAVDLQGRTHARLMQLTAEHNQVT
jgi:hypothetical protein